MPTFHFINMEILDLLEKSKCKINYVQIIYYPVNKIEAYFAHDFQVEEL